MGFNYENPHDDPNLGNYDFYVMEVKEFNRKLDEYQEEVNQKLADQDAEIVNFKTEVNGQINQLRGQLADFEADLNTRFNNFEADDAERFAHEMAAFNARLDSINQNIYEYLVANLPSIIDDMPELQDAIILNQSEQVVFTEHAEGVGVNPSITCNKTADDIKTRINNHTFNPIIVGLDSRLKHTVTEYWLSGGEDETLLYMSGYCCNRSGDTPGTIGVNRNYKFLLTYHQVGDSLVQGDIHYIQMPVFLQKSSFTVQLTDGVAHAANTAIPKTRAINITGCYIAGSVTAKNYKYPEVLYLINEEGYDNWLISVNTGDSSSDDVLTIEYIY